MLYDSSMNGIIQREEWRRAAIVLENFWNFYRF
jgi:hypothetical protein